MLKIEKNIAPPESAIYPDKPINQGPKSKYRFGEMEIGDSVFLEGFDAFRILQSKSKKFMQTVEGRGKHYAVAAVDNGARCWLVGIDNE